MTVKPVILTVDDDPEVLAAIDRDLRARYRSDYRVLKASSGGEALQATRALKARGTPIALFVVDQRMPEMTGTQLLSEARKLYPEARKVLLTAYADTDAAIASINEVGLDHYLMKPWNPPDQRLYPVLDDLLSDWVATVRLPFDGIRIAGARWLRQCYVLKEFLSGNRIPYQWIDIDQDDATRALVENACAGNVRLPVVFFPDGSHIVDPTNKQVAAKAGLSTEAKLPFYDLVIIGGGPAGLANAVYGASEGLRTLLVEQKAPGGQAGASSRIENFLGFPSGISGSDLAMRATAQARRFGAEMLTAQEARSVRREDPYRVVKLADGSEISCYAVLIATGMAVRMLDVPGIEPFLGAGVYYGAALSEAAAYRGQDVCVVGGANSAGQGALFFSRSARKVTMVVRGSGLRASMSQYLIDRIEAAPNIDVRVHERIAAVRGAGHLEQVCLQQLQTGEETWHDMAAMFIFIGAAPHSELVAGFVQRDEAGFILTGTDVCGTGKGFHPALAWPLERDPLMFETSVPGVFAAGDVRSGANRRVASAVGEGSAAIYSIHRYLETV